MDNFDKKIEEILKSDIKKPIKYEAAIRNALKNEKVKSKINIRYKVCIPICCLIAISTIVIANSNYIKEKIWKNPIIVNQAELETKMQEEITDEEKEDFITEDMARDMAEEIMSKLGVEKQKINEISLYRGYGANAKCHYWIRTNDFSIQMNPKTGELECFCDNTILTKNLKCDDISKEDAINIANEIYKKMDILHEYDGYEIMSAEKENIAFRDNVTSMWRVTYALKYDTGFDKNTAFRIEFVVVNGKTIFHTVMGNWPASNFNNNEIILSKEKAIDIATKKEKELSSLEISEVSAELSIEKMNIFIYCLENNVSNEDGKYQVGDVSRNVWVVEVKHNKDTRPKNGEIETVKQLYNKKYYVDATTGEIIGGREAEFYNY